MDLSPIFKAYDVRGVYPDQLDESVVRRIGAAFVHVMRASSIVVGRDMRISSEPLAAAFIEGAITQGADVVDVGLVSTDALYFASGELNMPGAMLTASHNPGRYNGIKMCRQKAAPVGEDTGLKDILRFAEDGLEPAPKDGTLTEQDILSRFVDHCLGVVDTSKMRPLKVAVDTANGMGGLVVPAVFDRLPVEVIPLYFELDGTFPNHPADPIQPDNLKDLIAAIRENDADLGLAFDGDADRVFLVDEKGGPASGSLVTALVAGEVLEAEPGAAIVHNLICSRVVPEVIKERGGVAVRTRVGHSFIKQVMAETGAAFGGEHSGHYYFRENFRADSGILCALYVLMALSKQDGQMSDVLAPLRRYWNSGEVNSVVSDQRVALERLAESNPDGSHDWTDGLTIEYPDWWFNARGSNTEPLLRLNVEARDAQFGQARTKELLEIISGA
ncbi:MAG TPA: phosphomannomutase/phosphoglucomutase [Actinomycetota bacterium]|nr:phosphomannomutase/phosphoglucomutase [Actinomycetota bacterium]